MLSGSYPFLDYWTFPPILRSFEATGYGKIEVHNGLRWRIRGGDCVLLVPPVSAGLPALPPGANRARARSLVWSARLLNGVPCRQAGFTYAAPANWKPPATVSRLIRKGNKEGVISGSVNDLELIQVLHRWLDDKKTHKPKEIVVRGHYTAMIGEPRMQFVGYRVAGLLVGAFGFCLHKRQAAIAFAKHEYGTWWLSRYLWIRTVLMLLENGAEGVVCGDTADRLKRELGFQKDRIYRVDFRSVEMK